MATKRKIKKKKDCASTPTLDMSRDEGVLAIAKEMENERLAKGGLKTVRVDPRTIIMVDMGVSAEKAVKSFTDNVNECRRRHQQLVRR